MFVFCFFLQTIYYVNKKKISSICLPFSQAVGTIIGTGDKRQATTTVIIIRSSSNRHINSILILFSLKLSFPLVHTCREVLLIASILSPLMNRTVFASYHNRMTTTYLRISTIFCVNILVDVLYNFTLISFLPQHMVRMVEIG